MTDMYQKLANSPLGSSLVDALNLPRPVFLERLTRNDAPLIEGHVAIGGLTADSAALPELAGVLTGSLVTCHVAEDIRAAFPEGESLAGEASDIRYKAVVFDATHARTLDDLKPLYRFMKAHVRKLATCARVLILGCPADKLEPEAAATHQALLGFVKSVAKEIGRKGATANLIQVQPGSETGLTSSLRFFLSPRSAFVDGQSVVIQGKPRASIQIDWTRPLAGKTALVTGASRGIGEAIARTLARDGARVVVLDIPAAESALNSLAGDLDGIPVLLDVSAPDAPETLAKRLASEDIGGVDIVVHNAGITRDKTLANMPEHLWDQVMAINIQAIVRINAALLAQDLIRPQGRIVGLASISGIAGNFGQSNYAASKAAVIGYVRALAGTLKQGITANAVAPGFIETQMTAAIPFAIREVGRRMNALSQGGQPQDVAEAIAWLASPGSQGITGQTIRVCGLNLIGQ